MIEDLLRDYRIKLSSLEILKIKREKILKQLKRIPDEVSYTNNTSLLKYEKPTYKISRMVENAGIQSAEIHKKLQEELNEIEIKIEQIEPEVKIIQALINSLDDMEKNIITQCYINGFRWYKISADTQLNIKTLKKIKNKAFQKMEILMEIRV